MPESSGPVAAVLIPAHQEEAVIRRCLEALLVTSAPGEFDIVVVANGCTDSTADIVRSYAPRVRLIELPQGSKPAALNAGEEVLTTFPRLYVDADVELSAEAVRAVAAALHEERPLIATPRRSLQTHDVTWPTRLYLRTWEALQRARGETIGTGVYALNEAGRRRFDRFPDTIGDDRFVHARFRREERRVVEPAVKVWPPRDVPELVRVRTRVVLGNMTRQAGADVTDRPAPLAQLRSLLNEPAALLGIPFYTVVTLLIRRNAQRRMSTGDLSWDRAERRSA